MKCLVDQYYPGAGRGFFCGILARRLGLLTIVGYLLAIAICPFTPGFVRSGDHPAAG
jgi:predicted Kef-type K+ transport protein